MSGPLMRVFGALTLIAMIGGAPDADLSDDDLIDRIARRGESVGAARSARESFERLYDRHAPPLRAFLAARVPRDDLADLEQDVWRRVWERLPERYHGGNFRAWLLQIARRAAIDHGRKRSDEPLDEPEAVPDCRHDPPEAKLIEQERGEALRHCLTHLESTAAAVVQGRLGGESYPELCARLGLATAQAHKLFHRAKRRLRRCVERFGS